MSKKIILIFILTYLLFIPTFLTIVFGFWCGIISLASIILFVLMAEDGGFI
jgi:hypothetical protein